MFGPCIRAHPFSKWHIPFSDPFSFSYSSSIPILTINRQSFVSMVYKFKARRYRWHTSLTFNKLTFSPSFKVDFNLKTALKNKKNIYFPQKVILSLMKSRGAFMKNTLKYFLGVILLFSVCAWSKASDILIVVDDEMIKDNEIKNAIDTYTDDLFQWKSLCLL